MMVEMQDDESARLREKLAEAEARAQRHYEEMGEYKSWLQQVEEGQETLKGTNDEVPDPVPDNPPGLGINMKVVSLQVEHLVIKGKIGSPEYRGKSTRGSLSSHGQLQRSRCVEIKCSSSCLCRIF